MLVSSAVSRLSRVVAVSSFVALSSLVSGEVRAAPVDYSGTYDLSNAFTKHGLYFFDFLAA